MTKLSINWTRVREFSAEPILTLEAELEDAVKREIEERRKARLEAAEKLEKKRKKSGRKAE